MFDKKDKIIIGLVVIVILVVSVFTFINRSQDETLGLDINLLSRIATSSAITIGTSSTDLIATSTARKYLAIVNTGANYVCLSLDRDKPAVDCEGIYLSPNGGSYEIIPTENLYRGAINAIANTGSSLVTVYESI